MSNASKARAEPYPANFAAAYDPEAVDAVRDLPFQETHLHNLLPAMGAVHAAIELANTVAAGGDAYYLSPECRRNILKAQACLEAAHRFLQDVRRANSALEGDE